MDNTKLKKCTSCGKIPEVYKHYENGSVYYNLICKCKKTPLNKDSDSMEINTLNWNKKWFNTNLKIVNDETGWESGNIIKIFNYYT